MKQTETTASIIQFEFTREEIQRALMKIVDWPKGYRLLEMEDDCGDYRDDILQGITLKFIKEETTND